MDPFEFGRRLRADKGGNESAYTCLDRWSLVGAAGHPRRTGCPTGGLLERDGKPFRVWETFFVAALSVREQGKHCKNLLLYFREQGMDEVAVRLSCCHEGIIFRFSFHAPYRIVWKRRQRSAGCPSSRVAVKARYGMTLTGVDASWTVRGIASIIIIINY